MLHKMMSLLEKNYETVAHLPNNVKTVFKTDRHHEIDHHFQHTILKRNITLHRITIKIIIELHQHKGIICNKIIVRTIVDRHHHSCTMINGLSMLIEMNMNSITVVQATMPIHNQTTEVDHHAGACSPTVGHLVMTKAVKEHHRQ